MGAVAGARQSNSTYIVVIVRPTVRITQFI